MQLDPKLLRPAALGLPRALPLPISETMLRKVPFSSRLTAKENKVVTGGSRGVCRYHICKAGMHWGENNVDLCVGSRRGFGTLKAITGG